MSAESLSARLVSPDEIDIDFAKNLQGIVQRAWTDGLRETRSPEVIAEAFDPDNDILVLEAQQQYEHFAKYGRLVVVSAGLESPILGFAISKNDVSPYGKNPLHMAIRGFKRGMIYWAHHIQGGLDLPHKVYALEKHVAVEPNAPRGVGTLAVKKSLEGYYHNQVSTAYIDDENKRSLAFFKGLGYMWDGNKPEVVFRFGENNDPTIQRRYIAEVSTVQLSASDRLYGK